MTKNYLKGIFLEVIVLIKHYKLFQELLKISVLLNL